MKLNIKSFKSWGCKHSPAICLIGGICGLVATGYLSFKAGEKFKEIVEEEEPEDLKETIQLTWKVFIPPVLTGVAASTMLISGHKINLKREAAATTAYALTKTAYDEYTKQTKEIIGEEKANDIQKRVMKKMNDSTELTETRCGQQVKVVDIFGAEWWSTLNALDAGVNTVNARLSSGDCVQLNDYYFATNGKPTINGDNVGWCFNGERSLIDIYTSPTFDSDGNPAVLIEYAPKPSSDYNHFG